MGNTVNPVRLVLCACISVLLVSTADCSSGTKHVLVSPLPLANARNPLVTPTYDGSGESIEPDVTFIASPWRSGARPLIGTACAQLISSGVQLLTPPAGMEER